MELWDVVITGFRLNATERPGAALERILCLGPEEARALTKRFPCVVRADLPKPDAQHLQNVLREAGAHVQLREPGRSMPPDTGMPASVLPSGPPFPASPRPPPATASASPPAPEFAPALAGSVPVTTQPAAAASLTSAALEDHDGPHHGADVAPRATLTAAMRPPAPSAIDLSNVPPLFRGTLTELNAPATPPVSLPYQLGELVVVPSASRPAPMMAHASSAPAPAQPPIPSQPAALETRQPASVRAAGPSQPAPIGSAMRSQPASASQPAPGPETSLGAMQMLEDPFGAGGEHEPALDIDESALTDRSARVQSSFRPNARVEVSSPGPAPLVAMLLWPIAAILHFAPPVLVLTGVAAISGAAVYLIRGPAKSETVLRHAEGDSALDATPTPLASEGATHPLLRVTPRAMEASVASILRARMAGVHKVAVTWPAEQRPEGATECMLVDTGQPDRLKELASTGRTLDPPADVVEQLAQHMEALRAASNTPDATFTPVCISN